MMDYILNCQSVEEAVAGKTLDLSMPEMPVAWSPDKPLCSHCWNDLACQDDLCQTCKGVLDNTEEQAEDNTGILIFDPDDQELSGLIIEDIVTYQISQSELLILTPGSKVLSLVLSLRDYSWSCTVIFPARGDMIFADALAMSRYYAGQIASSYPEYSIKLFFNHSHMRTLDLRDVINIDLLFKLTNVTAELKRTFPRDKLSALKYIFTKDRTNQKYELNRFYSMCSQDQKILMDQLEISELEPSRAMMLLQMIRYV